MMYLGLRTDGPLATFLLYDDQVQRAEHHWQADRQLAHGLLGQVEAFLHGDDASFDQLDGIFVYQGPGSFTGLRIGVSVSNTLAYGLAIPVVGTIGDNWSSDAILRLHRGDDDKLVLPHYGADPRITRPIK